MKKGATRSAVSTYGTIDTRCGILYFSVKIKGVASAPCYCKRVVEIPSILLETVNILAAPLKLEVWGEGSIVTAITKLFTASLRSDTMKIPLCVRCVCLLHSRHEGTAAVTDYFHFVIKE